MHRLRVRGGGVRGGGHGRRTVRERRWAEGARDAHLSAQGHRSHGWDAARGLGLGDRLDRKQGHRADGHLGQQSAGRDLRLSGAEVLGAGRHGGVGGEARLRLAVVLFLLILVILLIVGAVRVVAIRILALGAAHVTAVSCGEEDRNLF